MHLCTYMYAFMYVYVCIYVCVCMHLCMYMCTVCIQHLPDCNVVDLHHVQAQLGRRHENHVLQLSQMMTTYERICILYV